MKKFLKDMIPALVIAFSFSFMLFIYEPIIMYLSNTSDFWFDIYVLMENTLVGFIILFLFILLGYIIVYLLQKFVFKRFKNLYNICLILGFIGFLVCYIQGNYLSGKLPALDGAIIDWSKYKTQSIISLILLIVCSSVVLFSVIKLRFEKTIKYLKYVSLAICVMLFISLVSTCMTSKTGFKRKMYTSSATTKNIGTYSNKNNLIVIMLDSIDSETLYKIIQEGKYESVFKDFTYYPDTVGAYAFTRDSIPLMLAGYWSENKEDFLTFYNKSMDKSILLENLRKKDYNINIYFNDFSYNSVKARDIKNFSFDNKVDTKSFLKQEIKYDLYKYLPFYLKKYSKVEYMNFVITRKQDKNELYLWDDTVFLNDYLKRDVDHSNEYEFKFICLEGAHYPFNVDKDFNPKEKGTYEEKIEASVKLIDTYLKYLKENNVFDNSAIILMADHGFWWDIDDNSLLKRQNPMFFVKGFNEKHDMNISDTKVSYDNLQDIYANLLNGVKTDRLFDNIDTSKPRRFMLYRVYGYDHMEEFMQYGHSKNLKTLKKTGKKYDLEKK